MKQFLLALSLILLVAMPAFAQPATKEKEPVASELNSTEVVDSKNKKHDPKVEAHHDTEKSEPEANTNKDTETETPSAQPDANTNATTTTPTQQTTASDDDNTGVDSASDNASGLQSKSKNDNKSNSKNKSNKDNSDSDNNSDNNSSSSNRGWESGLIKKQPTRKRQVTVEEIDDGGFSLSGEGKILLVLILTLIAIAGINMSSKRLVSVFMAGDENSEIRKRANTLSHMVVYFLVAVTIGLAIVLVLKELGIDIGPILAGAGVVGVALGFGAQSIVRDFISGFYIFWEDQIRVGDVIQIADKSGYVEAMTLRLVTLRDENGNVHYIPCGEIKMVTNMTKNFSRYVLKISLPYVTDVDKVIEMVKEIDEELRVDPEYGDDILEPIEIMGIDQFENNAIVLKARTKTKPIKQWRVGREFNRRLKLRLDKAGIEMPYSNISLVMADKKNNKDEEKK
jgi:small conductance mechanosensitive channel